MGKRKTPLIQRLRDQSGTIYIFPSASEDINLNLNNTSNGVALSHYALLNIPTLKRSSLLMDYVESIEHPIKQGDGNSLMQVSLQNYMMNLETMVLNDPNYNFQDFNTVTERVFWKWFTKITNTRFTKITTSTGKEYYKHNAVSCFGKIDAENHLSTEFSMFNETYINIPTSYGGGPVYFREKTDSLLSDGVKFTDNTKDALEGRDDTNTLNISYTNFNDKPFFDNQNDGSYIFSSSDGDLMEIVKNVTNINEAINAELGKNVQVNNFDDINVDVAQQLTADTVNLVKDEFKFNAILLYYTVYDKNDTVKHAEAINLFGIIFLDGLKPVTNVSATEQYLIQPFVKRKSTATNFGNSFSFRVNMKTLSIYDNTDAIIQDNTTMSSINSVDFSDVISQLNKAVSIMNANAKTTEVIQDEYAKMKTTYNDQAEKITNLYHQLDAYINGNKSQTLYVSSLTADNIYNTIPVGDKDTLQEFLDIDLYNYPDLVKVSQDDELYLNPDCELFNKTENSTGIFEYLHGYDNDGNSLLNYVELIPYLLLKFQHLEQTEASSHIELTDIVCETLQVNKSANVEMLSIVSDLNIGQEDIKSQLNNKQDKLTAGNGIVINDNVISVRDENNSIKQGNNNLTSSFNLIGKDTKSKLKVDDEHANLSGLVYHVVSGTDPVQYDKVVQYSFATDKIVFQNYQTNALGALQTLNTEYKQDAKNITLTGEKIILNPSSAFEVSNCSVKMNLGTDNTANIDAKQINIETTNGVVVKNEYDTKIFELNTSSNETKINTRVDISVPADDRDNNTLSIRKDAFEVVVNSTTGTSNWQKMTSGGNPFAFGVENDGTKTTYFNALPNGDIYVYGVGGYVGTSTSGCQTLQDAIAEGGGGGGDLSNYFTKAECNTNFASKSHTHSEYAQTNHTHSEYALTNHTHNEYALTNHIHDYTKNNITLNGSSNQNPSFYAPTAAGTSGQYLKSNGSSAPTWENMPNMPEIPVGTIWMYIGSTAPEGWLLCNGEEVWVQDTKPSASGIPYASPTALYGDIYNNLYGVLSDYWYYTCRIRGTLYYWTNSRSWSTDRSNIGYSVTELSKDSVAPTTEYADFTSKHVRRLPDLRQRFPLGATIGSTGTIGPNNYDTSLGKTGGEAGHTLSAAESGLPGHKHDFVIIQGNEKRDDWEPNGEIYGSAGTWTGNKTNLKHIGSNGGGDEIVFNKANTYDDPAHFEDTGGVGNSANLSIVYNTAQNASQAHNNIPPYLAVNFIIKY